MNKVSSPKIVKFITKLLTLIAIAKLITLVVWWYLPSDGVEFTQKKNYNPRYTRVDFSSMLKPISNGKKVVKNSINSGINITDMILKGIYGTKKDGYAIVSMKSNPKKTSIISVEESYHGYKLKSINLYNVIFEKFGKNYILELEKIKKDISKRVQDVIEKSNTGAIGVSKNDIKFFEKNQNRPKFKICNFRFKKR